MRQLSTGHKLPYTSPPWMSGLVRILVVVLSICAWSPATSFAFHPVKLEMGFTPYRLGSATTIAFDFNVVGTPGTPGTPSSPVAKVDLSMPPTITYATSSLGLARCSPARLSQMGPAGCSANARIGLGTAVVAVPFGLETLTETVDLVAFVGNTVEEHIEVLYYATGNTPVISQLIMPGELLSAVSGEQIATSIPPIPTLPGAPDAAVVDFRSTIGPSHLYYYSSVHGKRTRFRPRGIALPASCPRGGFPFSAKFTFDDGSETTATDTVRCPTAHTHRAASAIH